MNDHAMIALACQIVRLRDRMLVWKQTAESCQTALDQAKHEAVSARADAVTRAEADRVRIEALTEELRKEREAHAETADLLNKADAKVREWVTENQRLRNEARAANRAYHIAVLHENAQAYEVVRERNQLLVEVAELRPLTRDRDALRAECDDLRRVFVLVHGSLGIQQGEHIGDAIDALKKERDCAKAEWSRHEERCKDLSAELIALKFPKPARQHPVAVGEWVRRTIGSDKGMSAQVKGIAVLQYDVEYDGVKAFWASRNCEPCDPPTEATHDTPEGKQAAESAIKREPKPGDVVRLVREPTHTDIPAMLPWSNAFGMPGDTATVVIMAVPDKLPNGTIPVRTSKGQAFFWPLSCIEVVKGGDK